MSEEKETYLRERGNLFQEPDSTLLLSVSSQQAGVTFDLNTESDTLI